MTPKQQELDRVVRALLLRALEEAKQYAMHMRGITVEEALDTMTRACEDFANAARDATARDRKKHAE